MNTATRTLIGFPPALLVTLGLLTVMITLMGNRDVQREEIIKIKIPNIIMPVEEVVEAKPIEKPVKPVVDDTPPPEVPKQAFETLDGQHVLVAVKAPEIKPGTDIKSGRGLSPADGEYIPYLKVAAVYPSRAITQGIEGHVILEYTVTKNGSVRDPRVIESTSTIFNQNAIKSALKYKYKPRVVNGEAVEVSGVRTLIKFRLGE